MATTRLAGSGTHASEDIGGPRRPLWGVGKGSRALHACIGRIWFVTEILPRLATWSFRRWKVTRMRENLARMPVRVVRLPSTIHHIFVVESMYIHVCAFLCVVLGFPKNVVFHGPRRRPCAHPAFRHLAALANVQHRAKRQIRLLSVAEGPCRGSRQIYPPPQVPGSPGGEGLC